MTFDDYQTAAARTINRSLSPADRLLDAAAGLAEEAGEVLGIVRKQRTQNRSMDAARLREWGTRSGASRSRPGARA